MSSRCRGSRAARRRDTTGQLRRQCAPSPCLGTGLLFTGTPCLHSPGSTASSGSTVQHLRRHERTSSRPSAGGPPGSNRLRKQRWSVARLDAQDTAACIRAAAACSGWVAGEAPAEPGEDAGAALTSYSRGDGGVLESQTPANSSSTRCQSSRRPSSNDPIPAADDPEATNS